MDVTSAADAAIDIDIESIKAMLDGFDPATLIPEISGIVGVIAAICRIAILVSPLILLGMGLAYLLLAPKEANYYFGYRTAFGMGSVSAWRHTQKVAGCLFGGLGLLLTAIMAMVCTIFTGMEAMDMVWLAVKCLIWEAVLSVAAVLAVNSIAMLTYDFKGNKRGKSKH